jgi:prevent-host-death family protein
LRRRIVAGWYMHLRGYLPQLLQLDLEGAPQAIVSPLLNFLEVKHTVTYTDPMKISVTDFKARCLALLEMVHKTGETVTVTKRGVPVADVVRARRDRSQDPDEYLRDSVEVVGDIISPVLPAETWEAESPRSLPKERPRARPVARKRRRR